MGKSNAVSKRRLKNKNPKFVRKSKLKKQRNKILKKSVRIESQSIRESWDKKKNMTENLQSMGLSLDPNKTLSNPNLYQKVEGMAKKKKKSKTNRTNSELNVKSKVIEELETIANKPIAKQFRFGPEVTKFCVYMIEKYGDNYKAMARDKINYYQESVGQIRQKIRKFKSIPTNWNSYMMAKEVIESNDIEMNDNS